MHNVHSGGETYHITLHYATPHRTTPDHAMPRHATLHWIPLCNFSFFFFFLTTLYFPNPPHTTLSWEEAKLKPKPSKTLDADCGCSRVRRVYKALGNHNAPSLSRNWVSSLPTGPVLFFPLTPRRKAIKETPCWFLSRNIFWKNGESGRERKMKYD